ADRRAFGGFAAALAAGALAAQAPSPVVEVDLATLAGAASVHAEWRYGDARVVEVDFRAPGKDRKPSGPPNRTPDREPRAGAAGCDDAAWPVIAAASLADRRGSGRLCFGWYRLRLTVPDAIDGMAVDGRTLEFEVVLDDYAEVWVDGRLPRRLGQTGGSL